MSDDNSEWRKLFGDMTVDEAREALGRLQPWTPGFDELRAENERLRGAFLRKLPSQPTREPVPEPSSVAASGQDTSTK